MEDKIKKAKMHPQRIITYGQNYLLFDGIKKKVLVQSPKVSDGVILNYSDIFSYELKKDGETITSSGAGIVERATMAGEGGIICSDLRLVIKLNNKECSEVVLPFISFSIDSMFAYKEALGAAKEAAQALEEIMNGVNPYTC